MEPSSEELVWIRGLQSSGFSSPKIIDSHFVKFWSCPNFEQPERHRTSTHGSRNSPLSYCGNCSRKFITVIVCPIPMIEKREQNMLDSPKHCSEISEKGWFYFLGPGRIPFQSKHRALRAGDKRHAFHYRKGITTFRGAPVSSTLPPRETIWNCSEHNASSFPLTHRICYILCWYFV